MEAQGGIRGAPCSPPVREVAVALAARRLLEGEGVPTGWFPRRAGRYSTRRTPPTAGRCSATPPCRWPWKPAVRQGWDRYIGRSGGFVGMSGFVSGPAEECFAHFGITAENVAAKVRRRL